MIHYRVLEEEIVLIRECTIHLIDIVTQYHRILDVIEEGLIRDHSLLVERIHSILHHDHPILFSRLHDRIQMADISLHDDISRGIDVHEYLSSNDIGYAIFVWEDDLTDDRRDHECELYADLRLHISRKCIDQTIECLDHVIGMQCRDDEVSCLGEGKDCRYRLLITHLTNHNDIRIFSHRVSDRLFESRHMFPDLFLVDETFIIFQNIFDRILDHDDVSMGIFIEIVDHRDDTRRLSTSRTTRDEDESFVLIEEFQDIFLESYRLCSREVFFDGSHGDSETIRIL